jgi:hypothetical protein
MRVGESARLEIRHDHGCGEAGLPGRRIPPHAVLLFDVELVAAAAPVPADTAETGGPPSGATTEASNTLAKEKPEPGRMAA